MKIRAILAAATMTAAGAAIVALPVAASTAPHPVFPTAIHATTQLTDRPDSGGNGDWAKDSILRTLTITQTGPATYKATVKDTGSFKTIQHAYTPNQGHPYLGDKIKGQVTGELTGEADYSFTASHAPAAHLVPSHEHGAPVSISQTTSDWFEQAFPAGTVFGGAGIGKWNWDYTAKVTSTAYRLVPVWVHGHETHVLVAYRVVKTQRWDDGFFNNGGQVLAAGNITG